MDAQLIKVGKRKSGSIFKHIGQIMLPYYGFIRGVHHSITSGLNTRNSGHEDIISAAAEIIYIYAVNVQRVQ